MKVGDVVVNASQIVGGQQQAEAKFSLSSGGLTSRIQYINGAQLPTTTVVTPNQPFRLSPIAGQNTGQGPIRR